MIAGLDELGAREVLLAVEANREAQLSADAELLALAAHWCDLHGEVEMDGQRRAPAGDGDLAGIGGRGTPWVEEFAAAEFGAMCRLHPMAAKNLMADALDLRHRLPQCWAAVHGLRLESWVARKVARLSHGLEVAGAAHVDAAVAPYVDSLPAGRLLALVEAKVVEADPARAEQARRLEEQARFVRTRTDERGLSVLIARAAHGDVVVFDAMVSRIAEVLAEQGDDDPVDVRRSKAIGILAHPAAALELLLDAAHDAGVADRELDREHDPDHSLRDALASVDPEVLRPQLRLFAHLTDDAIGGERHRVARVEGYGPVTVETVRDWAGSACVTVTPVLDIAGQRPVDGYEFPARLVEALHQLRPVDSFPWAVGTGRRKDTDHLVPYRHPDTGGPPGQTCLANGARLTRPSHRIKTLSRWHTYPAEPGVQYWRSPHGFWFRTDATGTHRCGQDGVVHLARAAAA